MKDEKFVRQRTAGGMVCRGRRHEKETDMLGNVERSPGYWRKSKREA